MNEPTNKKESMKKLEEEMRLFSIPMDLEKMEKDGLVEKNGAWYKVFNINTLPEHARKRIKVMKDDGSGAPLVQFTTKKY